MHRSTPKYLRHGPYLIDGDFPAYVEKVSLDELFAQADAISIHTLLNDNVGTKSAPKN